MFSCSVAKSFTHLHMLIICICNLTFCSCLVQHSLFYRVYVKANARVYVTILYQPGDFFYDKVKADLILRNCFFPKTKDI